MRRLEEIKAAHSKVADGIEAERSAALQAGNMRQVVLIESRRRTNDQAYFVLAWGQFEEDLKDKALSAVRRRRASGDRRMTRAWEIIEIEKDRRLRLPFESQVRLILGKDVPSGAFARLMRHYELRNRIAHGAAVTDEIDLPAIVADFYAIQSEFDT